MLLRFAVSNCRSIRSKEELSLVATSLKGPNEQLLPIPGTAGLRALPCAVVYGANASGKTNLLKAIRFIQSAVLYSHSRGSPEGGVPRVPFAFEAEFAGQVTSAEIEFVVDQTRYEFGFEANGAEFTSEWLFSFPEGKRRRLYERKGREVKFGSTMKGQKRIMVDLMRDNSLFISTATQNDHAELSKVVEFFRGWFYHSSIAVAADAVNNSFKKNQIDLRTIEFLGKVGTGIVDFKQVESDVPDSVIALRKEIFDVVAKQLGDSHGVTIGDDGDDKTSVEVELGHRVGDGTVRYMKLDTESSGTRRLLLALNGIFRAIDSGALVIIDELDASLHTHAAECILELFKDESINTSGAQLIATTHDTNLLNSRYLRRDEIWFCEKDHDGASHFYSLSDMKSRSTDDFERGYLEGRYGAIPFAGVAIGAAFRG